jgi:glutamyl-tRNA synthetase
MLSVVVDDHDMGITHVIRGDDHLTNTFRQIQIYEAFGWKMPQFGHIPLIHGPDGAKLSKRHGALGIESYREMGFLPEAVCNCLLRLGWSHGDDEIISREKAIEWFTTDNLGKSPSRLDFSKLSNLNGHYMREADNERLVADLLKMLGDISEEKIARLRLGMNGLKARSKTMLELRDIAGIYTEEFESPKEYVLENGLSDFVKKVYTELEALESWTESDLERLLRNMSSELGVSFGKIAQILRDMLARRKITPGIFEMLVVFGKEESLKRIKLSLCKCC